MYWLYGAYIVSIIVILLIELTKKNGISENGITKRQYYNPVLAFIYMCPLAYVAACRYRFWDTDDYRVMYEAVGKSFDNVFNNVTGHVEKGYLLFTALLNKISHNSQFLIIVSSIFILFLAYFFLYKESTDLPLSFLIFSSQVWMATMNGLRQYMAAVILWLVWRKWARGIQCKKNDLLFILSILLMASFHKSVLICIPLFFCARGKLGNKKVTACIIAAAVMIVISPIYNFIFSFLLGGTEYANYVDTSAAMGGARHVTAVDVSQFAVDTARENAERNGLTDRMDFLCADVFDLLPKLLEEKADYDMIILDPPAFTKSRKTVGSAERGYKEINYRAMRLLPRGGYLATCSCSHFMENRLFVKMVMSAARDAGVQLKLIEARQQAPDHPILLNVPEPDYLKFYLFQVVSG